ncbi:hypothetical protein OH492_24475 [Vibrio chagasii]|nr:hypothetical protein [Vibrio chagasii]
MGHGCNASECSAHHAVVAVGITYFAIVVGELVPKRFAQSQAETIKRWSLCQSTGCLKSRRRLFLLCLLQRKVFLSWDGPRWRRRQCDGRRYSCAVKEGSESGVIERGEQEMIRKTSQLLMTACELVDDAASRHDFLWMLTNLLENILKKPGSSKHSVFPLCQDHLNKGGGHGVCQGFIESGG